MIFLSPWASTFKAWIFYFIGKNFFFNLHWQGVLAYEVVHDQSTFGCKAADKIRKSYVKEAVEIHAM